MKIGVPKEIKIHEYRVGLVPAGVRELVDAGHQVLVQSGAGAGIGFEDSHYQAAGAGIAARAADIFSSADLIVKVKEPQLAECGHAAPRTNSVHVPAPGRRPRTSRGAPARRAPPPSPMKR